MSAASCASPKKGSNRPVATIEKQVNHSTVVGVPSVLPIWRIVIVTHGDAERGDQRERQAERRQVASPLGCITISTPTKPSATALQRCRPTASPSTSADSMTEKSGAAKPIVVASASGR